MKPIFTRIAFFLILTVLYQAANAQTYTVTTNGESWATLTGVNSNNCNNCTIIIPAGWTLNLNAAGTCDSCSFNGGTVDISHSFTFQNNATVFNNDTVLVGVPTTFYTVDFSSDSVAINAPLTSQNGTTTIANSRVYVNTSSAVSINEATFTNDSLHLNSNLTINNATDNFTGSNVDVADGVTITAAQTAIGNSTFSFAGSSSMSIKNGMSSTGSNYYLAGTSAISSTNATTLSGDNIVMTGSNAFISGNGLTTTNANFTMNGATDTLSAQSLTATGGTITAGTGSTVTVTNGASLTNVSTTLTGDTLRVQSLTTTNGSFSATNSKVISTFATNLTGTTTTLTGTIDSTQSLTTTNGSFSASGSFITSTNAIKLSTTPTTLINTNLKGQSITTSGSTFSLSNSTDSSTFAATFTGTAVTMTGNSGLAAQSATLSTAASLTMNGTSTLSVTNAYSSTGSNTYLNGNSALSSGSMSIASSSFFNIGGGPLDSTAYAHVSGGFSVDNTSTLAITNNDNYLYTTNGSLKTNTISCGGGGNENACQADYVYGCATIKNNAGTQCTVLALADISLTAAPAGANAVNLSWSDGQSATAGHYLVQRSTDNGDWTTLATIAAGGYTAGDYQFEDPAAPAGTDDYRIARVDQDGAVLYSAVSSITIATAATAGNIRLYPNPATGHTFFITVPNTEQLTVNIFTVTGQLLSRQSLQGQVQYQLLLPSQLLPGNVVIVQAISPTGKQAFPLLLQ